MNRAFQRRIKKMKEKYPDELEYSLQLERNSIKRLQDIEQQEVYDILRNNRVGEKRAKDIAKQILGGKS